MNRTIHTILLVIVLMSLALVGSGQEQIFTIEFDGNDNLGIVPAAMFWDGTPGVFGLDRGKFVINDMEGIVPCGCIFSQTMPQCGDNSNFASILGIPPIDLYCNVSVVATVGVRGNLECGNNPGSDPTGVCDFNGLDAMKIVVRLDSNVHEIGSYCGNERNGTFRVDNLLGSLLVIEITGGTQDPDEFYEIERIEITGFPVSFVPYDILNPAPSIPCQDVDPLFLMATGGSVNATYQWALDGNLLPDTGPTLDRVPVTATDAGTYSVTITDPSNQCNNSVVTEFVQVMNCVTPQPIFQNLQTDFCRNLDTLNLPSTSDNGISGTWNVSTDLVLKDTSIFNELIFTPDPASGAMDFILPINIEIIPFFGDFPPNGITLCVYDEPGQTVNLVAELNLSVPDIVNVTGLGMNFFDANDISNLSVNQFANGVNLFEFETVPFGACKTQNAMVDITINKIDRVMDAPITQCSDDTDLIDFNTQVGLDRPGGMWTDMDNSGIDLSQISNISTQGLAPGIYRYRYESAGSSLCPNLTEGSAILTLELLPGSSTNISMFSPIGLCEGDGQSFTIGTETFDENNPTGDVLLIGAAANTCDSMVMVDLIFNEAKFSDELYDGCTGDGYNVTVNNVLYDETNRSGTETLSGLNGCDSVVTVDLIYKTLTETILPMDLCPGGSIFFNGNTYDASTNLIDTFPAPDPNSNCDGLLILDIRLITQNERTIRLDLCPEESFPFNGMTYDASNPIDTVFISDPTNGCDSMIVIDLSFMTQSQRTITSDLCPGESFSFDGQTFDISNPIDTVFVPAPNGCDSMIIINLTFKIQGERSIRPDLCRGQSFTSVLNGITYDASNPQDIFFIPAPNGCDSMITIDLMFSDLETIPDVTYDGCEDDGFSVTLGGQLYDQSFMNGTDTLRAVLGCDTIVNIDLVYKPTFEERIETINNSGSGFSIDVNGTTYDESNPSDVLMLTAANGCDSIVTINLIFIQGVFDSLIETRCQGDMSSVTIGTSIYNESNPSGIDTFIRPGMPDSFFITQLTYLSPGINMFARTITSGSGLDTTFNNITYDESFPQGRDTLIMAAANTCDSIIIVDLNFINALTSDFDTTLCIGDDYSRTVGTSVYDLSNPSGTDMLMTADGIDSIVNTTLTFVGASLSTISESRCSGDGFEITTWNKLFNEANPNGSDTLVGGSSAGCDTIVEVMLVFANDILIDNPVTLCQGESTMVGTTTYDANNLSGVDTVSAINGCDTIITTQVTLDSISVDVCSKPACANEDNGSIIIYNMNPATPLSLILDGQVYNLIDSVEIPSLADGNYNLDIAVSPTCMIMEVATITRLPAQQLSIDTVDNGGDSLMLDFVFDGVIETISWEADQGIICSDCNAINIDPSIINTYTLTILDESDCTYMTSLSVTDMPDTTVTDTTVVTISKNFYVSNAITSEGQLENSTLYLQTADPNIITYDLAVYSRWGGLLFDKTNLQPNNLGDGWNPILQRDISQSGVYIYKMVLTLSDGKRQVETGDVLVIR